MSNIPGDLLYTKEDEWIRIDGDEGVVGITDHAQDSLSDIVFVELPDPGETFGANDIFGTVESVKAAADLYMPVDGEILETNEALLDAPEVINSAPYAGGWMIKIKIGDASQLDDLMDAEAYQSYCDERD
ncbi:MAG: glycine cleavage system protein GcvH [Candidatus Promineifilaceae bacterium]